MAIYCNAAEQQNRTSRGIRTFSNIHAATTMEGAIRLVNWWNSQRREADAHAVQRFIGCSRATAYRYLQALRAADGRA